VQVPGHLVSGSFGSFANIPGIIAGEGAKSRKNAQELLAAFDNAAESRRAARSNPSEMYFN
jgi:hypothetical protein